MEGHLFGDGEDNGLSAEGILKINLECENRNKERWNLRNSLGLLFYDFKIYNETFFPTIKQGSTKLIWSNQPYEEYTLVRLVSVTC